MRLVRRLRLIDLIENAAFVEVLGLRLFPSAEERVVDGDKLHILEALEIQQQDRETFAVTLRMREPVRSCRLALIIGLRRNIAETAEHIGGPFAWDHPSL